MTRELFAQWMPAIMMVLALVVFAFRSKLELFVKRKTVEINSEQTAAERPHLFYQKELASKDKLLADFHTLHFAQDATDRERIDGLFAAMMEYIGKSTEIQSGLLSKVDSNHSQVMEKLEAARAAGQKQSADLHERINDTIQAVNARG